MGRFATGLVIVLALAVAFWVLKQVMYPNGF